MNNNNRRKVQSLSPTRTPRLALDLIIAIHQSLVPPKCYLNFKDIADRQSHLFGYESTKERRSTSNKRHRLTLLRKNQFDQFKQSCEDLGVSCPPFFDPVHNIFFSTEEEFTKNKKIAAEVEAKRLTEEATRAAIEAKKAQDLAKIMSPPFLLTNGATDEVYGGGINVINLDMPEQNNGIFPILALEVVVGTEKMNCLNIIVPLVDPRDLKRTHYSAKLLPDYSGIIITEPTQPHFIYNSIKEMYNIKKKETCKQTHLTHAAVGTAIHENISRQTKKTVWKFPSGMKCTNEYFNEDFRLRNATMFDLKSYSRFVYQDHNFEMKLLKWYAPYLVFKLYVDGSVTKIESAPKEDDDLFRNAFEGMSII